MARFTWNLWKSTTRLQLSLLICLGDAWLSFDWVQLLKVDNTARYVVVPKLFLEGHWERPHCCFLRVNPLDAPAALAFVKWSNAILCWPYYSWRGSPFLSGASKDPYDPYRQSPYHPQVSKTTGRRGNSQGLDKEAYLLDVIWFDVLLHLWPRRWLMLE